MGMFAERLQNFFGPLSTAQKAMFMGLVLVIVLFMGTMFYWALKPEYTLLFGSMQAEAATEVVEELNERGVSYKLENDGRSIYVEADKVHELRLSMASTGMANSSDQQGYELFDENTLGMTDFMQQVNKKRALEGELARSINNLMQVESSRIHLVLPERTPFQQSSVEASASVILNLKRGNQLNNEQVKGITSLIAGSVEGMNADAVVVLDQSGNRLTDGMNSQSGYASGSMQMQLKQDVESYLTTRAQSMLDRALGAGNSLLQVSVEHDFDRLVRESDLIDPDSRTIISEERRSEISTNEASEQVPFDEFTPIDRRGETVITSNQNDESTVQTRNYEVNKTREVYEKSQAEIKRISASVLLNHKEVVEQSEEGEVEYSTVPYTQEEVNEFREIVRVAIGMQPGRGDELTITQLEFFDPVGNDPGGVFTNQPMQWYEIVRWSLIVATFLTIVALIYSIRKRLMAGDSQLLMKMPSNSGEYPKNHISIIEEEEGSDEEGEEFIDKKLSGQARKQLEEKTYVMEEIKDYVELKPLEAAQVVRALMTNDEN